MALRGNLKDFSLPDVFQLVTLSRKTGILRIRRADDAEGSVWFRDGDVFFAQSNWHHEPLGERLVQAGKITPSALARALEAQKAEGPSGRRLGRVLVDEGYISDKVLEAFVQEQIQDTIFDLFRWDEGDFDFEPLTGAMEEDIGLSVSIENIVMEGSRRLEEWARIKKKIPSMEIVFKMATAPGEGTFEISLKPVEWNLLLLVDGTRSVAELAADTHRTDFEVSRVLYGLFSAGLLEVASEDEAEKLRAERARLEARAAQLRATTVGEPAAKAPEEHALAPEAEEAPRPAVRPAQPAPTPAPEEQPQPQPQAAAFEDERPEPEMPNFLSDAASTPASAEDMAVFEEMMGAVLQAPQPEAPQPFAVQPEPHPIVVEPEPEPVQTPEPAPEATPQEPIAYEPVPVEIPVQFEQLSAAQPQPEPEVATEDVEMPLSDFFLGESAGAPAPPAAEEPAEEQQTVSEPMSSMEASASIPAAPATEEPAAGEESLSAALTYAEQEPTIAEIEAAELGVQSVEVTEADDYRSAQEPETPVARDVPEEQETTAWQEEAAADADLSDLLSSLRAEAEEPPTVISSEPAAREEGESEPTAVISTDAFLSDFDEGPAFSGGLGDELTALTGGGRTRPGPAAPAPQAQPEHTIHRDQMVDKELVMKVIEGIKSL